MQPSTSFAILSHSKTCDFVCSVTLEPERGKKGSWWTRATSPVCQALFALALSQMQNLGTVKASHQTGWLVGCGRCRCVAAPLFVQILPVVLGYRTNTAALGWKWDSRLSMATGLPLLTLIMLTQLIVRQRRTTGELRLRQYHGEVCTMQRRIGD